MMIKSERKTHDVVLIRVLRAFADGKPKRHFPIGTRCERVEVVFLNDTEHTHHALILEDGYRAIEFNFVDCRVLSPLELLAECAE